MILLLGMGKTSAQSAHVRTCPVRSFTEFAYGDPLLTDSQIDMPGSPWQVEDEIANVIEGLEDYSSFDVELVRIVNSNREIWIKGGEKAGFFEQPKLIVYTESSRTWEVVDSEIEGGNFYVTELFIDSSNGVWGQVSSGGVFGLRRRFDPEVDYIEPVLVKFNELTNRFEIDENTVEIFWGNLDTVTQSRTNFNTRIIVFDDDNNFWIFAGNYKVYKFNVDAESLEYVISFAREVIDVIYSAPRGMFILVAADNSTPLQGRLGQNQLFAFDVENRHFLPLHTPLDWPRPFGMGVDQRGNLWLGSTGYLSNNGEWHLVHTNVEDYFSHAGEYAFQSPTLMLVDSSGTFWFEKYIDMNGSPREGTAWFDPETKKGCVFTDAPTFIVEDAERILWLVAGGHLYKNVLG